MRIRYQLPVLSWRSGSGVVVGVLMMIKLRFTTSLYAVPFSSPLFFIFFQRRGCKLAKESEVAFYPHEQTSGLPNGQLISLNLSALRTIQPQAAYIYESVVRKKKCLRRCLKHCLIQCTLTPN